MGCLNLSCCCWFCWFGLEFGGMGVEFEVGFSWVWGSKVESWFLTAFSFSFKKFWWFADFDNLLCCFWVAKIWEFDVFRFWLWTGESCIQFIELSYAFLIFHLSLPELLKLWFHRCRTVLVRMHIKIWSVGRKNRAILLHKLCPVI